MSDSVKILVTAGVLIGAGMCLGHNIVRTYDIYKMRKRAEKDLAEEEARAAWAEHDRDFAAAAAARP